MIRPTAALLIACTTACASPHGRLREQLQGLHATPSMHRATLAMRADDVSTGEVLFEHNADKLLLPASTMKLVTAAAVVRILGTDRRLETRLVTRTPITDGVLHGDLTIVGGGDPSFGMHGDPLGEWVQALVKRGVTRIEGDVVADTRLFAHPSLGAGWAWDDARYDYSAPVEALTWQHGVTTLVVAPGEEPGASATLTSGAADCLPLRNEATTIATGPELVPPKLHIDRWGDVTVVAGTIGADAEQREIPITLPQPASCVATLLKAKLAQAGIDVVGAASERAPDAAEITLATHRSPPVGELLALMLAESNNLYAETLARHLDPATTAKSFDGARPTVEDVLRGAGVPDDAYVIRDGSGLSRYNRLSAEALVVLLRWIWAQPWREELLAMLPVTGVSGTLKERTVGGPASGRVRAKTGSMTGVYALAGVAERDDGTPVLFALLSDGVAQPRQAIRRLQDAMLEVLVAGRD